MSLTAEQISPKPVGWSVVTGQSAACVTSCRFVDRGDFIGKAVSYGDQHELRGSSMTSRCKMYSVAVAVVGTLWSRLAVL